MNWNRITSIEELETAHLNSSEQPIVIFKHSTRCSISSAALARFERSWDENAGIKPYYLDLLAHRDVSNAIASKYNIEHQSPQALLIQKGVCQYHASHMSIDVDDLKALVTG